MNLELEAFKNYLVSKNYSPCTCKAYMDGIEDYLRHGFTTISTPEEINYRETLKAEGKKAHTVNLRIAAINTYNRLVGLPLIEQVKINQDPFAVDGMDLDDYYYMLDCLLKDGKYKWYVVVKVLAATGMRIGEASSVTIGDIRRGSCTVFGKGGKERTIYFPHTLQESLFMFIKDKADTDKLIPYGLQYVRTALQNIKRRYGLKCKVSPHEFRRFFSRQMYEATHDAALVKGLLGHESLNMTTHYIKKTQKQALYMYARAQNW